MLSHQVAKSLANDHLRAAGSQLVAGRCFRDATYGIWTVTYVDPDQPDPMLIGGALVVTDGGEVHPVGSAPGALDDLMAELGMPIRMGVPPAPSGAGAMTIPATWHRPLASELEQPYWSELSAFVEGERVEHDVFPPGA